MGNGSLHSGSKGKSGPSIRRAYEFLAARPYSVIMYAALFCTLAVKLFHSLRSNLVGEYFIWIPADVSFLLILEVVLSLVCFRWRRRWVVRTATIITAVVCTWSVMNAGILIRQGMQILPANLLPLLRDPLNTLGIIGVNLVKMPVTAVILLGPSAVALAFFFSVLARPRLPDYNRRLFAGRIIVSVFVVVGAIFARGAASGRGSVQITSAGLRYNCQLRAVASLLLADSSPPRRKMPAFDEIRIPIEPRRINHNVVIVVLEGIQYSYTSLADTAENLTPYIAALARHGVEFTNTRSTLTHTTKVLFSLLTGRYPSVSQDLAETVPAVKPYAGLATILKSHLNFRTAFFQSAKGNFESRPGLVHNLGFDKFWARDHLENSDAFIGYLGCDEFAMLKPVSEWIKAGKKPFLLVILCSVTHDPYEVPQWYATPAKDPAARYRQAVSYTDTFLAALDAELASLNLTNKTIFCVIGDHGEAFGEHGMLGHEAIAFDEVLQVPFVLRAPSLVQPESKVTNPVGSVDLTPTLLALLGFNVGATDLDGIDVLADIPDDRKVYFSGWMQQSPAGFVKGNHKFVYNPTDKKAFVYDLSNDRDELARMELPDEQGHRITTQIISWRKNSIFRLDRKRAGKMMVFDRWLCRWGNRSCLTKHCPPSVD
jgi:arylsulfatase A-like enzyme